MVLVGILAGIFAANSGALHQPNIQATLNISSTGATKPILSPGELFGSFFEDFLHASDGGVYGEKLSNRAFALPISTTRAFRCSGTIGTEQCSWFVEDGSVKTDASLPLNDKVPNAMWLESGAVASNAGFPGGIVVHAGEMFEVSLFVHVHAGQCH